MTRVVLENISVQFGGLTALQDVSADWSSPAVVGLIGANGAGKTTLLNVMTGMVTATTGSVQYNGKDITRWTASKRATQGMVRSFQSARLLEDSSVLDNILLGADRFNRVDPFRQFFAFPKSIRNERDWREKAREIAARLNLESMLEQPASALSTATRRLVEIGRVLMAEPDLVLLDEPAAGLASSSRDYLADMIRELPEIAGCLVVLVEHDVGVVRRACTEALALASGRIIARGDVGSVLDDPAVRASYFGEKNA